MYLPVPIFGYVCDRVGPAPLSFFAGIVFGLGYMLAAFTYRSGAVETGGWPFPVMVLAFVAIGMGTTAMYLSAITTCAKNFGRGKHKGLALAAPIAAFGLSGMWQSQIGSRLLYEVKPDGKRGDVDVFKYFMFLAIALLAAGLLGTAGLRVVDEDELIDDAVEALETSGMLEDSAFFQRIRSNGYGSFDPDGDQTSLRSAKSYVSLEARKKTWLLNSETRLFLADHTMWFLALGLFLVTGPGEAFINNLGTIIGTLYPPTSDPSKLPTTAATHVSIVAITSTLVRILTGTLTDLLAPVPPQHQSYGRTSLSGSLASLPTTSQNFAISRVTFLLAFALLLSLGQILLASGLIQNHGERFWLVSSLIGGGYGAVFSITPIIISVIWGVENFGTNWGIVSMVPALGATVWGVVYSAVYQWAAKREREREGDETEFVDDVLCYGKECYSTTFWAMAVSVWLACALWAWAWRGPGGWKSRGIAV
jgi:MFS family permease